MEINGLILFFVENKKIYIHPIFKVNWSLLSKAIKGKQKLNFGPLENFVFFGTILLVTFKLLNQIKRNIYQSILLRIFWYIKSYNHRNPFFMKTGRISLMQRKNFG